MSFSLVVDPDSNTLLFMNQTKSRRLHPIWLRERTTADGAIDVGSFQRLYDPTALDADLTVTRLTPTHDGSEIVWSDGHTQRVDLHSIATELGWLRDPSRLPDPVAWATEPDPFPRFSWPNDDDDEARFGALDAFWTHGFVIFSGTPSSVGSLTELAGAFGPVRPTNFGELFDVFTKPNPVDLAYTPRMLTSHTDNPYRRPVPGIQFLHCIENHANGGESTLVDGLAAFHDFAWVDPEGHDALCNVPVTFRYHYGDQDLTSRSAILETDIDGTFVGIRNSDRLDFVDAVDPETLARFYSGRASLRALLNAPERRATFVLQKGDLLMMDNRRLLHGRLSFELQSGRRHLQGCYIEHDGPEMLWRKLSKRMS